MNGLEKKKSRELLNLISKYGKLESEGLAKFVTEHLNELPSWKAFFEKEGEPISNQRIGFSVGMRLSRLVNEKKLRRTILKADSFGVPQKVVYEPANLTKQSEKLHPLWNCLGSGKYRCKRAGVKCLLATKKGECSDWKNVKKGGCFYL